MQDSKKINIETQKVIGKLQLQEYGSFSDTYNKKLTSFKKKLSHINNIHNVINDPITLEPLGDESVTILNLVNSDNKLLSRMLASLASICSEMKLIVKEAEEYYVYFNFTEGNGDVEEKPSHKFVQTTYENLQKIMALIYHSQKVINLLLQQLNALFSHDFYQPNGDLSFTECIDNLANVLVSLVIFDKLLSAPNIKQHCSHFLRIVQSLSLDPSKYNFSIEELKFLESNLQDIQKELLCGQILKNAIQFCTIGHTPSAGVSAEFVSYISQLLIELDYDGDSVFFTQLWLQANALVVFHWFLFGDLDKKLMKKLLDLNKKICSCTIAGNILWNPEEFLLYQIPSFAKSINLQSLKKTKTTQAIARNQNLLKETVSLSYQASLCIMNIEKISTQNVTNIEVKDIQEATKILIEAMKLVKKISELIKWTLRVHADLNLPIAKSTLLAICKLIEILKCFELTFKRNSVQLVYIIMLISQHLTYKALTMILSVKKNLVQDKSYKQKELDILSALSVCEHAMKGCNTNDRLLVAKLALTVSGLSKDIYIEITHIINRLELFNSLHSLISKMFNFSFLYEHSGALIPTFFTKLLQTKADLSRYYLILSAFSDCTHISEETLVFLEDSSKKYFLDPLIQNVETNLRLQTHLHLALPPSDPFTNYITLNFKTVSPVKLHDTYWSPKNETEHYLSMMFYNLTTVVMHDWQTYGEMRRLASLQYNLETVEDKLPMQTIEQGLDVLEIMRNINIFVSNYLYNLNLQVFVEEKSNNKHLNVINISHVANSIRTHGIGIMNTTVNFTYQFLQKKFFVFSQFIFDEQIKSRLLKDIKFFSEHKTELNQMYPYERAEKFNYGIRKLGLNENGHSYLDLFRKLISHIGNAMGYVRLIRSGGRRSLAEGTCFIPDFKQTENTSNYFAKEDLPESINKAVLSFTSNVNTLVDNFEEATEYFKLLVDVFVPIFRDPKHIHLKNFFIIVPPLTINFVEHSLTCKERLNKKNKNDAAFTDDGFAMGLAFIIELLQQEEQVNSLCWFESVMNNFKFERNSIYNQRTKLNKDDEKLQQTLSLTERRIATYEREFRLLYCNYRSARIFFQS